MTLRSVSPLWSQELHYTMMAQDDDMMKMSISIYFKCQGWLPPYTPCVSIASCHSARGRKVRSSKYSLNIYLELILPSSLHCCCCRYLQICRYLLVCLFANRSANVGDLLVSEASGRDTLIILIMRPTPPLRGLRCLLSSAIVDISALFYAG